MRRFFRWDSTLVGGKRGFTLIELLIVMVILAILAGIVIISIGGVIGRGQETAYNAEDESIQTAVLSYYATENSTWPTADGDPGVVNMRLLICDPAGTELPYLDEAPASAYDTNYFDQAELAGCEYTDPTSFGHYLWSVDSAGGVYSECQGADCGEDGGTGWQGVYP